MIVSTPNIESAGSKASFVRSGSFLWFSEREYLQDGHISPLTQWQIHKAFSEAGFLFLWKGSFGDSADQISRMVRGSPRLRLFAQVIEFLSSKEPLLGGEIFIAVLKKPDIEIVHSPRLPSLTR